MLDDALEHPGDEVEIEDLLEEAIWFPAVKAVIGGRLRLTAADRKAGSLPNQVKAAAERQDIDLPDGWKASTALALVSQWAESGTILPDAILDRAATLFTAIGARFSQMDAKGRAVVGDQK